MTKEKKPVEKVESDAKLPLTEKNYILLAIGFAIIVLGFILMSGGEPASAEGFNYEIFSWRRITLAPIVVVFGFAFEIYAIMKRW